MPRLTSCRSLTGFRSAPQSLTGCFSQLDNDCGPQLLTAAIKTSLALINLLYPLSPAPNPSPPTPTPLPSTLSRRSGPPTPSPAALASLACFTALSDLFANAILHTWQFHGTKAPLEEASCAAFPSLLQAFEGTSGTIRFLPALVPHLCGVLEMELGLMGTVGMRVAAAEALVVVVVQGEARMHKWRPQVLGAVGRAWCGLKEGERAERGVDGEALGRYERALREIVQASEAGEGKEDVDRLIALDQSLFGGLCALDAVPL